MFTWTQAGIMHLANNFTVCVVTEATKLVPPHFITS